MFDFDLDDFPTLVDEIKEQYPNISNEEIIKKITLMLEQVQKDIGLKKWQEYLAFWKEVEDKKQMQLALIKALLWSMLIRSLANDAKKIDFNDEPKLVELFDRLKEEEKNEVTNDKKPNKPKGK